MHMHPMHQALVVDAINCYYYTINYYTYTLLIAFSRRSLELACLAQPARTGRWRWGEFAWTPHLQCMKSSQHNSSMDSVVQGVVQ